LVVSTHPSEKWWSLSVGMMTFPTEWTVIKFMFQTTNQGVFCGKLWELFRLHKLWEMTNMSHRKRVRVIFDEVFCTAARLPEVAWK
jgi:hypothetical protein